MADPLFGEDITISGETALRLNLIQILSHPAENSYINSANQEPELDWRAGDESDDADTHGSFPTPPHQGISSIRERQEYNNILNKIEELPTIAEEFTKKEEMMDILKKYIQVFDTDLSDPSSMKEFCMNIELKLDAPVIKAKPRRDPPKILNMIREEIKRLLDLGIIVPSQSYYASSVVMKQKAPGLYRMCIDYTDINNNTVSMVLPLPNIDDIFHDMEGHCWYAKFDLRAGYHQLWL
jgi:hypothetical protein